MAESEFSQLRRLCDERRFSLWPRAASRSGPRAALRRDVRGGSVVAVPSSDHRGLSHHRWRAGVSYSWARQGRNSEPDAGGPAWAERHSDLSAASGGGESMNESGCRSIREKFWRRGKIKVDLSASRRRADIDSLTVTAEK